jgi:hypothetical protein
VHVFGALSFVSLPLHGIALGARLALGAYQWANMFMDAALLLSVIVFLVLQNSLRNLLLLRR